MRIGMEQDEINRFYEVSEFTRSDVLKWCKDAGVSEDEYIRTYMTTAKYAWLNLYFSLFKLFTLKEFQIIGVVFVVGLVFIYIFVE